MKLTGENYYSREANRAYLSVSQYKAFRRCEAAAMAELYGQWQRPATTALLVGSYVDAYFEGTLAAFQAEHPEILKRDGTLRADYAQAEALIARIEADALFMEYMAGEKQRIFTAPLLGAVWKIKVDSYHPDKIVDLKIMRSLDRVMGNSFVEHWDYDLQMAVYAEVEALSHYARLMEDGLTYTGDVMRKPTFLAVATKETPANLEIIEVPGWRREECLDAMARHMPRILEIKKGQQKPERCGNCDYCRMTKVLTAPVDFELVGLSLHELRAIGVPDEVD